MNPELVQYCGQAIINYLGGDIERFKTLKNKALNIYDKTYNKKRCKCGAELVKARIGNKYYKENAYICLNCGLVHGKRVENIRRYKAC